MILLEHNSTLSKLYELYLLFATSTSYIHAILIVNRQLIAIANIIITQIIMYFARYFVKFFGKKIVAFSTSTLGSDQDAFS